MKKLSRDEMKKVMGGNAPQDGGCDGRVAHCYGTYSNCQNSAWGDCTVGGPSNCISYCVHKDGSVTWD